MVNRRSFLEVGIKKQMEEVERVEEHMKRTEKFTYFTMCGKVEVVNLNKKNLFQSSLFVGV